MCIFRVSNRKPEDKTKTNIWGCNIDVNSLWFVVSSSEIYVSELYFWHGRIVLRNVLCPPVYVQGMLFIQLSEIFQKWRKIQMKHFLINTFARNLNYHVWNLLRNYRGCCYGYYWNFETGTCESMYQTVYLLIIIWFRS